MVPKVRPQTDKSTRYKYGNCGTHTKIGHISSEASFDSLSSRGSHFTTWSLKYEDNIITDKEFQRVQTFTRVAQPDNLYEALHELDRVLDKKTKLVSYVSLDSITRHGVLGLYVFL